MKAALGILQDEFELSGEFQVFQGWREKLSTTPWENLPFSPAGTRLRTSGFLRSKRGEFVFRKIFEQWKFIHEARALSSQVDLFHLFLPTPSFLWIADRVKMAARKPVVVSCLAEKADSLMKGELFNDRSSFWFHLLRYAAAKMLPKSRFRCDLYLAGTSSVAAQLQAAGCPREKIQIGTPLLPQEPFPDERSLALGRWLDAAPTLLYLGHFLPNKGVEILLDAFAQLQRPQAKLLLAWSGLGDLRGIQKRVRLLDIEDRVLITDYPVHRSTVYAHASALVLPARASYGQVAPPIIVLEAFRAGIPVVLSRLRSITDVGDEDKTVFFMESEDSQAFVRQLQRVIDQPEIGQRMRSAQREWFKGHQNLNPATMYDAIMKLSNG